MKLKICLRSLKFLSESVKFCQQRLLTDVKQGINMQVDQFKKLFFSLS